MRGAARIGGRAFRPTPSSTPRDEFNPLEALDLVGDLPVAAQNKLLKLRFIK